MVVSGLLSLIHHGVVMGVLFGIICLLTCRCQTSGLLCHLYDNDDPIFVLTHVTPDPNQPIPTLTESDMEMTPRI
jgi:hypothetical protein